MPPVVFVDQGKVVGWARLRTQADGVPWPPDHRGHPVAIHGRSGVWRRTRRFPVDREGLQRCAGSIVDRWGFGALEGRLCRPRRPRRPVCLQLDSHSAAFRNHPHWPGPCRPPGPSPRHSMPCSPSCPRCGRPSWSSSIKLFRAARNLDADNEAEADGYGPPVPRALDLRRAFCNNEFLD